MHLKQKNAVKPANQFEFYSSREYYSDLASKIAKTKSGDRIALATMAFQPSEPLVKNIFNELCAAAKRNVSVYVMVDAFSFIVRENSLPGPLLLNRKLPSRLSKTFKTKLEILESLKACSGHYRIINKPLRPLMLPFSGRSHIKFAVVNEDIFIGGCNLAKDQNIDLMVGCKNSKIADWLYSIAKKVLQNGSVIGALGKNDLSERINKELLLMLDVGVRNQSLIFDKALALIDSAEQYIYFTCQYFPNDITIRSLTAAAERGVDVTIVYNNPGKHLFPFNLLHHGVVWSEKLGRTPQLFSNQLPKKHNYLHAKLLATDKGTIIGSHNFVRAGVKFGTAEIALFSTNKQFGENAVEAFKKLLL